MDASLWTQTHFCCRLSPGTSDRPGIHQQSQSKWPLMNSGRGVHLRLWIGFFCSFYREPNIWVQEQYANIYFFQVTVGIWDSQVLQSMVTGWMITWYVPLTSWMRISVKCNVTWSQTASVIILKTMGNTSAIWITLLMNTTMNTQATSQRTKIMCIAELR